MGLVQSLSGSLSPIHEFFTLRRAERTVRARPPPRRANPPWIVDGRGKPAQFVRVRVGRKSYLALSEVEVYRKKF